MPYSLTRGDRLLIAAALAILACLLILDLGTFWQGCHDPDANAYSQAKPDYDDCAADGVVMFARDASAFIHLYHDDLTALSTAVIALFTIVLAQVTGRQARITKLVADASKEAADAAKVASEVLPAIERAYLFEYFLSQAALGGTSDDSGDTIFEASFTYRNHGKTPGVITHVGNTIAYFRSQPNEMPIDADRVPNMVVAANGANSYIWDIRGQISISDLSDARDGGGYILFIGRITYDDVLGLSHDTWFCREFDFEQSDFAGSPNFDLNRRT
jgi:hypothetical protein